ncbi:COP1-interactive protein 1-like isoform X2 [Trichoplusia ni]|uniref:COP1-interactive protein 1-like isoform X2 n=1 Tax=Trichoplusia ni TaxID=7111 RepID=A0A7E5VJH8_TRINI|nr:COP1-interactive protein 1-like isoform X2 [Trichoplusia ni]
MDIRFSVKLSTYMASCGHLPTQYSIMETLLRWLLPRQDRNLRVASAAKWFPPALYEEKDVEIFLERPWVNFFQDARDFLNAHNGRQNLITSVVCRRLTVGKVVVISGEERQESWLDINSADRSVTVLMDPRVLEAFGCGNLKTFETLVITEDNTETAKLHIQSSRLLVSLRLLAAPGVRAPLARPLAACDVTAHLASRCDVTKLDAALRNVFDEKYQRLLDLDKSLELSPVKTDHVNKNSEQDSRFSHPVEVKRRTHSGYIVKSRQNLACMSPSTASTSSLAQLHEKLAALPHYKYDKEPVSVCALPELSIVTEYSEADNQSNNTTLKFKPYGVCQKNLNKLDRKSQSDPESSRKSKGRRLSAVNEDASTASCLLVATIGSTDDSIINDTVERLSKSKDYNPDNIVDLLVHEALQAKENKEKTDRIDSGINTGEKKSDLEENSEAIENTPNADEVKINKVKKITSKVLSSTSDESNTEAINETPCFVNTRRKIRRTPKTDPIHKQSFDEQVVEEFFSQHFTENKETREIIISPTLAKKINETSSEASDFVDGFELIDEVEENIVTYDFNNIEVIECLNSMVDKVCDVFDKCTKYLNEDEITADPEENMPLKDIMNTIQDIESTKDTASKKKPIKLKYKAAKKGKTRAAKRKNKLELEPTFKMSTIIEDAGLESAAEKTVDHIINEPKEIITNKEISEVFCPDVASTSVEKPKDIPNDADLTTPQVRRKRKLYSPKDEQLAEDSYIPEELPQSTIKVKKTPKTTATCYKDIEKERQKKIRLPRTRRNKKSRTPSPRTKKLNDIFDKVKDSANNEKVKLADNTFEVDIYNFTSDSDDDFKEKKIDISKRNSTTTVASIDSTASRRRRAVKRIDYTDYRSSDESNKVKRKVNRKPRTKKKVSVERNELIDERLRKAKDKDILNSSMVVEKSKTVVEDPDFVQKRPEMEAMDEQGKTTESSLKKKGRKNVKTENEAKNSRKILTKAVVEVVKNFDDDRTESPLPGLLVEPEVEKHDEVNELSSTMVDKFKKIYQEGPEKYGNDSNTTQNLLSEIDRINFSTTVDVTEEIIEQLDKNKTKKGKNTKIKKNTNTKAKTIKKERKTTSNTSNKENVDVITMLEISDVKSERSIETVGITGHGELEEAPPSPKLIGERLEPRNLEVDDLDHSMKDYFNKLTKNMNESHNRDSSSNKNESIVRSPSPVVSIKRLSPEDISRWLPSRRTSDSDESYASAKSVKQIENVTKPNSKEKSLHNDSNSKSQSRSKKYDDSDSDCSIQAKDQRLKKTKIEAKKTEKPKKVKKQTSLISPIKLFDDLISNADKQSESTLSDDEEYMKEIIHTLSKKKVQEPKIYSPKLPEAPKKRTTAKPIDFAEQKRTKSIDSVSSLSKYSTSTKIDDSRRLKRKSVDERDDSKRKRVEVNNNEFLSSSGVTVSSVDDWFKRIEPTGSRAEEITASYRHSVQNVMEKLDTTLVEIHRNTSKKFAHLFVDAQKHLSDLKEQRRGMYKQLASDILTGVVKMMDEKFADLDKRSQELDGDFMKILKERTSELIREDCKQKRVMVQLLREDVQAVVEHMEKQGHS